MNVILCFAGAGASSINNSSNTHGGAGPAAALSQLFVDRRSGRALRAFFPAFLDTIAVTAERKRLWYYHFSPFDVQL